MTKLHVLKYIILYTISSQKNLIKIGIPVNKEIRTCVFSHAKHNQTGKYPKIDYYYYTYNRFIKKYGFIIFNKDMDIINEEIKRVLL